jgi:hypothetical protein
MIFDTKQLLKKGEISMPENRANRGWAFVVAVAAIIILISPNISSAVESSLGNVPVFSGFFKVVTLRYGYEDDRNVANLVIPKITTEKIIEGEADDIGKRTADGINAEIQKITEKLINDFTSNLDSEGYRSIMIDYKVIDTTEGYFTIKLICFQSAGSGYEENYYFTIDLNTGKKVELADLFKKGSDYIRIISENIKEQMREQMAANNGIKYWLDLKDYPEWSFNEITDKTAFFINENGEIVICFNEGDVAPMSMGIVEFTIPKDLVADIIK